MTRGNCQLLAVQPELGSPVFLTAPCGFLTTWQYILPTYSIVKLRFIEIASPSEAEAGLDLRSSFIITLIPLGLTSHVSVKWDQEVLFLAG